MEEFSLSIKGECDGEDWHRVLQAVRESLGAISHLTGTTKINYSMSIVPPDMPNSIYEDGTINVHH